MGTTYQPPASILIIGSGVFGLSTAYALTKRPEFANTKITVISKSHPSDPEGFPPPDASSIDSSRIVRADYADPAYAALGVEALQQWRRNGDGELGGQGRYREDGLILVADEGTRGLKYVRESWENALRLADTDPGLAKKITLLPSSEAIGKALGTGGATGDWGYLNGSSGWADAAASMHWIFQQVKRTGRVNFVSGTVAMLLREGSRVKGTELSDGRRLEAELIILAAGAWSPSLVDLGGQAVATGQVIAYIDLTDDEQHQLENMPTILNLTSGAFIITPANNVLKIARHAYGYLNPVQPACAAGTNGQQDHTNLGLPPRTISVPETFLTTPGLEIPLEGAVALRKALHDMVSLPSLKDRPFKQTRLCWYTDTPTGDFLVDYHPHFQGLFIATGGSGHAFKFLPVIGEKVADCMLGKDASGLREKWAWKRHVDGQALEDAAVVTEDGSRGGVPGLLLADELAKTA